MFYGTYTFLTLSYERSSMCLYFFSKISIQVSKCLILVRFHTILGRERASQSEVVMDGWPGTRLPAAARARRRPAGRRRAEERVRERNRGEQDARRSK